MTRHYPELGSALDWSCHVGNLLPFNQKHYPDLGSDASSIWNFCAPFSDIILPGNEWWHREVLAVFSCKSQLGLVMFISFFRRAEPLVNNNNNNNNNNKLLLL